MIGAFNQNQMLPWLFSTLVGADMINNYFMQLPQFSAIAFQPLNAEVHKLQ